MALFVSIYVQQIANTALTRTKKESILNNIRATANNIRDSVLQGQEIAKAIAQTNRAHDFLTKGKKIEDIPNSIYTLSKIELINEIFLIDDQGIISARSERGNFNHNFVESLIWQNLQNQKKFFALYEPENNDYSFFVAAPVVDQSKNIGYVLVSINLKNIYSRLTQSFLSDASETFLINNDGIILTKSPDINRGQKEINPYALWEDSSSSKLISNLLTTKTKELNEYKFKIKSHQNNQAKEVIQNYQEPGYFEYFCENKKDTEIFFYTKLDDLPLFLTASYLPGTIRINLTSQNDLLTILSILSIAIGASIVAYLMIGFVRPIKNIQKSLDCLANGESYIDHRIKTHDEFRQIGDKIAEIAQKINQK